MDVPRDHETYLHRIGRAGRFGKSDEFKTPKIGTSVKKNILKYNLIVCSPQELTWSEQTDF